jgi:hypothetical protein
MIPEHPRQTSSTPTSSRATIKKSRWKKSACKNPMPENEVIKQGTQQAP